MIRNCEAHKEFMDREGEEVKETRRRERERSQTGLEKQLLNMSITIKLGISIMKRNLGFSD